jgi:hypothetical protein
MPLPKRCDYQLSTQSVFYILKKAILIVKGFFESKETVRNPVPAWGALQAMADPTVGLRGVDSRSIFRTQPNATGFYRSCQMA